MLQANPLCVVCEAKGRITVATEIDHIVPLHKDGPDTPDNCQQLCGACHQAKTAQDMGYKPKGSDIHGLPTDPRHPWYAEQSE